VISAIRRRLTYANVAMTLALVFAMSGGAYAAKHYQITSTKQISPKVLKQLRGKRGPAGPAGAAGPAGPAGPMGVGAKGENGTNGASGVSPTGAEFKGSAHGCKEGGVEFKGANTTYACNGVKGAQGEPGPLLATLPSGKTETGFWGAGANGNFTVATAEISLPFPLSSAPTAAVYIKKDGKRAILAEPGTGLKQLESTEEIEAFCPGTAAAPSAQPGYLCAYTATEDNMEPAFGMFLLHPASAEPTAFGTTYPLVVGAGAEEGFANGSWAVTAK
jgi:hypothetical protein